jgi:hypothetical protein
MNLIKDMKILDKGLSHNMIMKKKARVTVILIVTSHLLIVILMPRVEMMIYLLITLTEM